MTAVLAILGLLTVGLSAVAAADIAADRRRPLAAWVPAGLLVPVVAPVLLWLMPPNPRHFRRCSWCKDWLRGEATVCPHCTREQAPQTVGAGS